MKRWYLYINGFVLLAGILMLIDCYAGEETASGILQISAWCLVIAGGLGILNWKQTQKRQKQ